MRCLALSGASAIMGGRLHEQVDCTCRLCVQVGVLCSAMLCSAGAWAAHLHRLGSACCLPASVTSPGQIQMLQLAVQASLPLPGLASRTGLASSTCMMHGHHRHTTQGRPLLIGGACAAGKRQPAPHGRVLLHHRRAVADGHPVGPGQGAAAFHLCRHVRPLKATQFHVLAVCPPPARCMPHSLSRGSHQAPAVHHGS